MRILSIAIIALLAFAGALQAQVAAPRLNVGKPVSIAASAFNPAVLPWGGPSRVGVGFIDMTLESTMSGMSAVEIGSGDGIMGQVRLVGENFAFHVEQVSISLDFLPIAGGGSLDIEDSFIGVAYQGGGVFSIGLGVQKSEGLPLKPPGSGKASLPLLGATLRIQETIFLGAAVGNETVKNLGGEGERSVVRAGAALHSRDTDGGYHLEVYIENKDRVTLNNVREEETTGLTAELIFAGGILIGIEVIDREETLPSSGIMLEVEKTAIAVGWVGSEGLSVVLNVIEDEETDNNNDALTFDTAILSVSWLF